MGEIFQVWLGPVPYNDNQSLSGMGFEDQYYAHRALSNVNWPLAITYR